jgi:DNA-nicking Smr family endonuclease
MAIDPLGTGRTSGDWNRIQQARDAEQTAASQDAAPRAKDAHDDTAEVSDVARTLASTAGDNASAIDPARLAEVLDRLTQGHYTEQDVLDIIARKLGPELGLE